MSRTLWTAVMGAALAVLFSFPSLVSGQAGDQAPRVARLVRELGADSFAVRSQASEELAKLGATARPEIEKATRSDDPEVRLRAKDLLQAIKVRELWSASQFTVPASTIKAADAVRLLAEQTGNHVLIGDQFGSFHEADVKLTAGARDFWPALDELCRQSGNHCRPHYDSRQPGVVVVAGAPGKQPLAYAGPVRARITSARRAFNEELSYEEGRSEKTHSFELNVEMTWEERFKLVAYRSQPDVLEAVTTDGLQLAVTQPGSGGWSVAGTSARPHSMKLRLGPPPASAAELETLRISWGVIAVGNMASLTVDNLESQEPHFQDDVELIVDNCQTSADGRCELAVSVRRALNLPEPPEILFQEHELELLDATEKPLRKIGQSNSIAEHGALFKATFMLEGPESKPHRMRFTYPRLRSMRDVEIVFHGVPLPTGRPE